MTLRSLDILGKYSLYSIPRDDGGDDGGTGYDGGDAFGFGETGDFGFGYDGMSTADGEGSAAADAGYAAGEAAAAAVAAAAGDGSLGAGDYGSYAGTAAGDAIAAGYGLAGGDLGTGTGDAFGFAADGYVGYDSWGNPVGGLSGYEGFGAADGGISGGEAAAAANALGASGQGWGAYAAGTTAAAVANALAAQGKAPGWIAAAIESQSFAAGFANGLAASIAAQAQQAAQVATQGLFGPMDPQQALNPVQWDQYNAIIDQVTRDVTAQKTAQVNSVFGIDLNNPMTFSMNLSFKDFDVQRGITAQQEIDEQMDVPAPLSEQFGVPAGMPTAGLGIYGGALGPGITSFSPGPVGPLGPLGPTSPFDIDNLEPPGLMGKNVLDPNSPFADIDETFDRVDAENPDFFGEENTDDLPGGLTTLSTQNQNPQDVYDIINTPEDPQSLMDDPIGFMNPAAMVNRDIENPNIDPISGKAVTSLLDLPGPSLEQSIIDAVQDNPAQLSMDWGFQQAPAQQAPDIGWLSQVASQPTNLGDMNVGMFGPNPSAFVGQIDSPISVNPDQISVTNPEPIGPPQTFAPIDWSTFVSPIDFSQFNVDPPQFNNPITFENQNPFTGLPSWATGQFGSLDFTGLNPNAQFGPNPFADPGPFVGPTDPGPTTAPTSITVGGTVSGDPTGGAPSAFGATGGLLGGDPGVAMGDPGAGNVDPGLLWWMLQQQQLGAGSPVG